ncbi:hypothetical protein PR048_020910 [Dryococelus australis]|uniref:Uncharacterized protein n=1 Tax=Dryococelus australis TaxID=614101 RepID=A0ABQ9GWQ1_9NEOP|nr:hypothetical protein PR048_020910 [Dryococelus australis]
MNEYCNPGLVVAAGAGRDAVVEGIAEKVVVHLENHTSTIALENRLIQGLFVKYVNLCGGYCQEISCRNLMRRCGR